MHYLDFRLRIARDAQRQYRVSVLGSPAGEASAPLELPLELQDVGKLRIALERSLRGCELLPSATGRPEQGSLAAVGERLFAALFPDPIQTLFDRSWGQIQGPDGAGQGLRIKLQLDPSDPGLAWLASLPWEFLFRRYARRGEYLSRDRRLSLVRYLEVDQPPQPQRIKPPLRILTIVSRPRGVEFLDTRREQSQIEEALRQRTASEVVLLEKPTRQRLRQALRGEPFHVIHFMGHGSFNEQADLGVLDLEDESGDRAPISGEGLANLLKGLTLPRLMVLNACDSAHSGSAVEPFAGVATALVEGGLSAVVAMQFPISDDAAISFSTALFEQLAQGTTIDEAVTEGRIAVGVDGSDTLEWGTPVLFMRTPDGRLFDLGSEPRSDEARARNESEEGRTSPQNRYEFNAGRDQEIYINSQVFPNG